MTVVPVTPDGLVARLADRIVDRDPGRRTRVVLDGAPPTRPEALADALADALRVRGRDALAVRAADFLRPASLRLEHGRTDPDALLDGWLDLGALRREVLDPAGPDGSGLVLPRLWDAGADRAFRDGYRPLAAPGVLLLAGGLLLGRGLPAELGVHLRLGTAALRRGLPADEHWTLPAYARHDAEHRPAEVADVVVLADHPQRPALRERTR